MRREKGEKMKATLELNDAGVRRDRAVPTFTGTGRSQAAQQPTYDMIARRAYEIWQHHGCPIGTSFGDWLAAEAELRAARRYGRRESGGRRHRLDTDPARQQQRLAEAPQR